METKIFKFNSGANEVPDNIGDFSDPIPFDGNFDTLRLRHEGGGSVKFQHRDDEGSEWHYYKDTDGTTDLTASGQTATAASMPQIRAECVTTAAGFRATVIWG